MHLLNSFWSANEFGVPNFSEMWNPMEMRSYTCVKAAPIQRILHLFSINSKTFYLIYTFSWINAKCRNFVKYNTHILQAKPACEIRCSDSQWFAVNSIDHDDIAFECAHNNFGNYFENIVTLIAYSFICCCCSCCCCKYFHICIHSRIRFLMIEEWYQQEASGYSIKLHLPQKFLYFISCSETQYSTLKYFQSNTKNERNKAKEN